MNNESMMNQCHVVAVAYLYRHMYHIHIVGIRVSLCFIKSLTLIAHL